jgi:hypothetical protein
MTHKRELHLPTEDIYARLAGIGCSLAVEPQCNAESRLHYFQHLNKL